MSKEPTPKADALRAMREAKHTSLIPYAGKPKYEGGVPFTKQSRPQKPPAKKGKKR